MFKSGRFLFLFIIVFVFSSALMAVQANLTDISIKVPASMNYQGYITDNDGTPVNGLRNMRFVLFDSLTGGNSLVFITHNDVSVSKGYFNVILSESSDPVANSFKRDIASSGNAYIYYNGTFREKHYMEISVYNPSTSLWETLAPRQPLSSVPYAMAARKVVYTQVLTVAYDGGDEASVSKAIDRLLGQGVYTGYAPLSPAPSISTPWIIKVQAGCYNESGTSGGSGKIVLPDNVSIVGESFKNTRLDLVSSIVMGNNSSLENIRIMTNYFLPVNASNVSKVFVKNCHIEGVSMPLAIDFSGSVECAAEANYILQYGNSTSKGINLAGSRYCYIINNIIDLAYYLLPASTSNCRGITDSGTPFIDCYITGNIIRYVTTGSAGTTASAGIAVSAGGTGSIANNVFHKGAAAKDIIDNSTGSLPAWGTGGPRGNFNMRSDGTAMPSF